MATTSTRSFGKLQLDKCCHAFSGVKLSYVLRLDVGAQVSFPSGYLFHLSYNTVERGPSGFGSDEFV